MIRRSQGGPFLLSRCEAWGGVGRVGAGAQPLTIPSHRRPGQKTPALFKITMELPLSKKTSALFHMGARGREFEPNWP